MTELTVKADRSRVAAAGASVTASVRIQPGMQEAAVERHIALCIDTSGSMSGEKIEQVREGVRWVFGYLEDEDVVSIVSFDDEVEVVLPATRWGDISLDEAEAVVDDLRPGGGTDILAGLEAAHGTLADLPAGDDVGRRILLLSDGRDDTPVEEFGEFARRVRRDDGIAVPSAGIGEFYDEATIRTVGTASDGEWVHLARATDVENFFGRKVETLRTVVAPSPNLQLELPEGAGVRDVFLRQPQVRDAGFERSGNTVHVFLPDLVEFETQEVVLTIDSPPCQSGAVFALATVTLNTPSDSTSAVVSVECVDEAGDRETTIESKEVAIKQVETMVRKAVGDGDVGRAETMVRQVSGEAGAAGGGDVDGLETTIGSPAANDESPTDADEARSTGDGEAGPAVDDEAGSVVDDEVRSAGGDEAAPAIDDEATRVRRPGSDDGSADRRETKIGSGGQGAPAGVLDDETAAELRDVVDDEAVSRFETVIKSASADDREAQYQSTIVKDDERG